MLRTRDSNVEDLEARLIRCETLLNVTDYSHSAAAKLLNNVSSSRA